jgi:hypothetical protein
VPSLSACSITRFGGTPAQEIGSNSICIMQTHASRPVPASIGFQDENRGGSASVIVNPSDPLMIDVPSFGTSGFQPFLVERFQLGQQFGICQRFNLDRGRHCSVKLERDEPEWKVVRPLLLKYGGRDLLVAAKTCL